MKLKLDSGREVKLKDVSLDDRDEMLDKVEYQFDSKGNPQGVKMMHSTITFWLRRGLDGDASDDFIRGLTLLMVVGGVIIMITHIRLKSLLRLMGNTQWVNLPVMRMYGM